MKKFILLFLIFALSKTTIAQTNYPSGVTGCIARWTFDGESGLTTLADVSGNNNNGTINTITSSNGWRNQQYQAGLFNGISSYAEVPHATILNPSQISIVALVKFNGFYSGNCQGNNIIYKGFDYNSNFNWAMYVSDGNYDNSCTAFNPTKEKMNFATPNFVNTTVPLSNFIDSSKWYLLASTFDGTVINYYQIEMDTNNKINNITPSYSANCGYPTGNGNHQVYLGATQNAPFPYWFNGKMDEVILFNKALSNTEIQSVYDFLWGYPTSISEIEKDTNPLFNCSNDRLSTLSTDEFSHIDLYDISGRLYKKLKIEDIQHVNLNALHGQICIIKAYSKSKNQNQLQIITQKILIQ